MPAAAASSSALLATERLYVTAAQFGGCLTEDEPSKPAPARGLGGMGPRAASAAGCLDGSVSFGFSDVLPNMRPRRSSSTPWGLSTIRDGDPSSLAEEAADGDKSDSDDDEEPSGSPPKRRRAQS